MASSNELRFDDSLIKSKLSSMIKDGLENPILFFNTTQITRRNHLWLKHMQRIRPFYAVKCNNNPFLLQSLASLGFGFDCASEAEIKSVLDIPGVSPNDIVYANPCKPQSHIKYALKNNVPLMTFDNEAELHKMASIFPSSKLVIRIRADSEDAPIKLGTKFGCSVDDSQRLISIARDLGLNIIGVSFHVGSGCQSPSSYEAAISMARQVFEFGKAAGFNFTLLDIGGGFPGNETDNDVFINVAKSVNYKIDELFSDYPELTMIAEPGRFFAASCLTLATQIISKRVEPHQDTMYYINDGVYGTFSGLVYGRPKIQPCPFQVKSNRMYPCSIWGPTCDSIDKIGLFELPEMDVGDWLIFHNMGAYSTASSSGFNGFPKPEIVYYTEEEEKSVKDYN